MKQKYNQKKQNIPLQSCTQCGICCTLFLINLTKKEWESGKYNTELKEFDLDNKFETIQKYGGNILKQNRDGSCIYLIKNICSIHNERPQFCKNFFCSSTSKKYKSMIEEIKKNKALNSIA